MEKNFTPGKWVIETCEDKGEITEIYICKESGGCILCVNDGDDNSDIETDLANAQLIANAPELLGALERLILAAEPHCVPTSQLNMRVNEAKLIINQAFTPQR